MLYDEVSVWVIVLISQFISAGFLMCIYYVPGTMLDYKDTSIQ